MGDNIIRNTLTDMGLLSQLSYLEFGESPLKKQETFITFIDDNRTYTLSTSYTVIDYIDTSITNMQAMLLRKNDSSGQPIDEYVIAFRGTQEFADASVDVTIGLNNFNPQFSDAKEFVQAALDNPDYDITTANLTLTGHSLGGILTQSVGAVMGIKGYAFNPYGTERLLTTWPQFSPSLAGALVQVGLYKILDALGLFSSSYAAFAEENILNISHNDFGKLNGDPLSNLATALTSDNIGNYLAIFGENVGASGHYLPVLNAAIKQYNDLLAHFTPETTYADLSKAYVFGGDDGFNRVNKIFDKLGIPNGVLGGLEFNFLFDKSVEALQTSDAAGMFALLDLIPFTIKGADYSRLNTDEELERKNYSDKYIEDRALFLYHLTHPDATVSNFERDINFTDARLEIVSEIDNSMGEMWGQYT